MRGGLLCLLLRSGCEDVKFLYPFKPKYFYSMYCVSFFFTVYVAHPFICPPNNINTTRAINLSRYLPFKYSQFLYTILSEGPSLKSIKDFRLSFKDFYSV